MPIVQGVHIPARGDARPFVGVHGVVIEHGPGHVSFLRFPRFPNAPRGFGPIVASAGFVALAGIAVPIDTVPLRLVVVHLAKGVVAARAVRIPVARPEDVDVALHGFGASKEGLRHDVFRIDGVGVGHKPAGLLKPSVDAFHVAVAHDVGVAVHLPSCFVVAQTIVLSIVPVALQPPAQILQLKVAWRVGLPPSWSHECRSNHHGERMEQEQRKAHLGTRADHGVRRIQIQVEQEDTPSRMT